MCRPLRRVDLRGSLSVVNPYPQISISRQLVVRIAEANGFGVNAGCNVSPKWHVKGTSNSADRVKRLSFGGTSDATYLVKLHNLHESSKASPPKQQASKQSTTPRTDSGLACNLVCSAIPQQGCMRPLNLRLLFSGVWLSFGGGSICTPHALFIGRLLSCALCGTNTRASLAFGVILPYFCAFYSNISSGPAFDGLARTISRKHPCAIVCSRLGWRGPSVWNTAWRRPTWH